MPRVEPIPNEPAATAHLDGDKALVIGDYHAGIETALRADGVEIDSRAAERREQLLSLVADTQADRVIFLGDLAHWIGEPEGTELEEIETLISAVTAEAEVLVVKGNHDGNLENVVDVQISPSDGIVIDDIGFVHGHTIPSQEVIEAEVVCVGHEHVMIRLEDSVGGSRLERAWIQGELSPDPFAYDIQYDRSDIILFPAFNDLVGGTWVNVKDQEFLSPFLPDALTNGEAFLLDGTRLGDYRDI